LQNYLYRVKTPDSVKRKVERHPDLKFQSVFNDIIGLRVRVPNYNICIPEYFRKVDLTEGKANDDGYRALHLYYKLDNNHYQIEIQLWSDYDYNFNLWSHTYGYKAWDSQILRELRELYDNGEINNYQDYLREAGKLLCQ
jgi:putative GTP pyrophosphokinase